jgi:hypothetical protein
MSHQSSSLSVPDLLSKIGCVEQVLSNCNGSYRCEIGIMMGMEKQGTSRAKRICDNFKGLDSCIPEQTCVGIRGSTYESCMATSHCLQQK